MGVTPAEFGQLLPSRPVLTSDGRGWRGVTLQRFRPPPGAATVPPVREHRLSLHLDGTTLYEGACDGRRVRHWSGAGCSYVRPAGVPAAWSRKGRPDFVSVHLAPALVDRAALEALDRDPAQVGLVERAGLADPVLDQLGRLLLAEAESGASGTRLMADTLATALAVHLLRCHSNLAPQPPRPAATLPSGRLRRVVEYMGEYLDEDLSLAQLALVSGFSASHFARAFRAATGEPPHRYLVRLRVERACGLLERTELSVVEVALQCGFEQPTHFATTFRKLVGLSPRAWRVAHRG